MTWLKARSDTSIRLFSKMLLDTELVGLLHVSGEEKAEVTHR